GQGRAGRAGLVRPRFTGHVPQAADVAAGAGEIVVARAVALHRRAHVLALQLERAADPERLDAQGGDPVRVGHVAGIDQPVGHIGTRAGAVAHGVAVGVVIRVRQAQVQDAALLVDGRPEAAGTVAAAVRAVARELAPDGTHVHAPVVAAVTVAGAEPAADRE